MSRFESPPFLLLYLSFSNRFRKKGIFFSSLFVLLKQVEEKNAEMQVLKRTGEELSQGQSRLKELVERMKREEEEVDRDTAILQQKKVVASLLRDFSSLTRSPFQSELETLQERAAEEEPLDPDEAVEVPRV